MTPYFQNKLIKLYHGNCLQIMPNLSVKFNAIITDPPYGCLNKKNKSSQWDNIIDIDKMWKCINNVIYNNTPIILFSNGFFTAQLIVSNPYLYKYNLVWMKNRKTGFLNANKMPLRQHEDIIVFYDKLPTYNPQMVKCQPHQKNHSRGKGSSTNRCYGQFKNLKTQITDYKFPTSIINIDKQHDNKQVHPTQKPIALMEYLIKTYSNENEQILDFCAGSGSTGIACMNLNRKCVLIQKEEKYCEIIKNRIIENEKELNERLF